MSGAGGGAAGNGESSQGSMEEAPKFCVDRFWAVVLEALQSGVLSYRSFRCLNGGFVYFEPNAVIEAVTAAGEFSGLFRAQVREVLAQTPEWVRPTSSSKQIYMRLYAGDDGSKTGPVGCWCFKVSERLSALAQEIAEKSPKENSKQLTPVS
jgi:hypothetical protein